jgi:hypothetical protein
MKKDAAPRPTLDSPGVVFDDNRDRVQLILTTHVLGAPPIDDGVRSRHDPVVVMRLRIIDTA